MESSLRLEIAPCPTPDGPPDRLKVIRREYARAKRRASYWASIPFVYDRTKGLRKGKRVGGDKYHEAIEQVHALASVIAQMTGKPPKRFAPRDYAVPTGQGLLKI